MIYSKFSHRDREKKVRHEAARTVIPRFDYNFLEIYFQLCFYVYDCMNINSPAWTKEQISHIPYPSIHPIQRFSLFFSFFSHSKFSPNTRKIIISDEKFQILFSHSEPHKANLNNTKKKRNPELIHMEGAKRKRNLATMLHFYMKCGVCVCVCVREPSTRVARAKPMTTSDSKDFSQIRESTQTEWMEKFVTKNDRKTSLPRSYQTRSGNTVCHKINSVIIIIKMWIWHSQLTEL